jgi:hypothetical protein
MMMKHPNLVIGVFPDPHKEKEALDELKKAGFREDQLGIADHAHDQAYEVSVAQALQHMGFSEEEVHFYDEEYCSGNELVTVEAVGRGEEAECILRRVGARMFEKPSPEWPSGRAPESVPIQVEGGITEHHPVQRRGIPPRDIREH